MPRECERTHAEGGGCSAPRAKACCVEVEPPSPCDSGECLGDTGLLAVEPHLEGGGGGGGGCTHVLGGDWALVAVLLGALLRRRTLAVALGLGLAANAEAVDVAPLDVLDGAPVPGLADPALAEPWTLRVGFGGTTAAEPVRMRDGASVEPLIVRLSTVEGALSLQLDDLLVVGVGLPVNEAYPARGAAGAAVGDPTVFLRVPLGADARRSSAFEVRMQRASGQPDDPASPWTRTTSASFGWAGAWSDRGWWLGFRGAARAQPKVELAGLVWGSRWEAAGGVRRDLGPAAVGASLVGSAPLLLVTDPTAAWPLEALGFGAVRLAQGVELQAGGGGGLTRGLGTPKLRLFASLRLSGPIRDRDGDGYLDVLDACASRPEDFDGFRDKDGCPEPDNDGDGLVDLLDSCPDEAEVFNRFDDEDGCPDALARWTVDVSSPQPLETVRIAVDGEGGWGIETSPTFDLHPGEHLLVVEAPGHTEVRQIVALEQGDHHTPIELRPLRMGVAMISLTSGEEGPALEGTLAIDGEEMAVPIGGLTLPLPQGTHVVQARAPGHHVDTARVLVPSDRAGQAVIALEALPSLSDPPPVVFDLGSDALTTGGLDLVETLAAWLRDHPEIRILRVEGHADEVGGSAYNLALSEARAEAVVEALVERGIAETRLRATGSGEARSWLVLHGLPPGVEATVAGEALREVSFQVLVWADG